jgi:hypothetical protein
VVLGRYFWHFSSHSIALNSIPISLTLFFKLVDPHPPISEGRLALRGAVRDRPAHKRLILRVRGDGPAGGRLAAIGSFDGFYPFLFDKFADGVFEFEALPFVLAECAVEIAFTAPAMRGDLCENTCAEFREGEVFLHVLFVPAARCVDAAFRELDSPSDVFKINRRRPATARHIGRETNCVLCATFGDLISARVGLGECIEPATKLIILILCARVYQASPLALHNLPNHSRQGFECAALLREVFMAIIDAPNASNHVAQASFSVVPWNACPRH